MRCSGHSSSQSGALVPALDLREHPDRGGGVCVRNEFSRDNYHLGKSSIPTPKYISDKLVYFYVSHESNIF